MFFFLCPADGQETDSEESSTEEESSEESSTSEESSEESSTEEDDSDFSPTEQCPNGGPVKDSFPDNEQHEVGTSDHSQSHIPVHSGNMDALKIQTVPVKDKHLMYPETFPILVV